MIENVLTKKGLSLKLKITVKGLISVGIVALAVILPQLVHLAAGQAGGVKWLPMYLPVLIGGCLLGWKWGLGIGVASPAVIWAQIQTGLLAVVLQSVIVPLIVMGLKLILDRNKTNGYI